MKTRKFEVTIYNRENGIVVNDNNDGRGYQVTKACNKALSLAKDTLSPEAFMWAASMFPLVRAGLTFSNVTGYSITSSSPDVSIKIHTIKV